MEARERFRMASRPPKALSARIARDAALWSAHVRTKRADVPASRINADAKAAESISFSIGAGAQSFAIPSKLIGTRRFQPAIRQLALSLSTVRWQPLSLSFLPDGRLLATWGGLPVGFVQDKHARWLRPLLETGEVAVWVLAVTMDPEAPVEMRGVNVVFSGVADAIRVIARQAAA